MKYIVAIGCILVFVIQWYRIFDKEFMTYDETVTSLAITGNMERFHDMQTRDSLRALEVQKLIIPFEQNMSWIAFCKQMSEYENHPVLYCWIYSRLVKFFGYNMHLGIILNYIISICSCVAFFFFLRRFYNLEKALYISFFLVASPACFEGMYEAKNYLLFGFFSILYFGSFFVFVYQQKKYLRWYICSILVGILGLWSHFLFVF